MAPVDRSKELCEVCGGEELGEIAIVVSTYGYLIRA